MSPLVYAVRTGRREKEEGGWAYCCKVRLDEGSLLVRTKAVLQGDIMWSFGLEHVLALDIVRELRRANVLADGVSEELQEGERSRLANVDCGFPSAWRGISWHRPRTLLAL